MTFDRAVIGRPSDRPLGRTLRGDEVRIVARSKDTAGSIGIFEVTITPGSGPDWHTHTRETEVFHVVSGRFRFWCGPDEFEGGPGTTVTLPPNVPHQWKNIGQEAGLVLAFVTPGGFEENFIDIAGLEEISDDALAALDEKYAVRAGQ